MSNNTSSPTNKPEDTLRDGSLKATIWRNDSENGPFYTTSFARTYKDGRGHIKDANSFSAVDLLKVGELARSAYHRTSELRRDYLRAQENGRDQGQDQAPDHDDRTARRDEFNERRTQGSAPAPEHNR